MSKSEVAYVVLCVLIALQRIAEVFKSRKHQKALERRGGYSVGAKHYPAMVLLHTSWILTCMSAPFWDSSYAWSRSDNHVVLMLGGLFLLCGQFLRIMAMQALGERWTVTIHILPGVAPIRTGIYRYLNHPNYWGVCLELIGLPLVFGLTNVALFFGIANLIFLMVRIPIESAALTGKPTEQLR